LLHHLHAFDQRVGWPTDEVIFTGDAFAQGGHMGVRHVGDMRLTIARTSWPALRSFCANTPPTNPVASVRK